MIWGNFGTVHIVTLLIAAGMIYGLYLALKNASRKTQTAVLGILSFSGIAAIIYNLVMWDEPLAYLPLHLCSLNAMALPFAVFTRNKRICNLLLVWSLGALVALVLNYEMVEVEVFSDVFFFYYFPHVMEFGIPILLFVLGHAEKDPKCIGSTVGITMVIYTFVHVINKLINASGACFVNYMFSIQPNNPLTELFYKLIPYEYWYMYMVVPILVVYLLGVYAPQIRSVYKSRAAKHA